MYVMYYAVALVVGKGIIIIISLHGTSYCAHTNVIFMHNLFVMEIYIYHNVATMS